MTEKMVEVMLDIQQRLSVPKGEYNNHGCYSYRTCEGILSALKPFLAEHKGIIWFEDEIVNIDGWKYMKATVNFQIANDKIECRGFAREAEVQKGMNSAQITGAASSYARKYALCGLFGIDDGNDHDRVTPGNNNQQLNNQKQTNNQRANNSSSGQRSNQNNSNSDANYLKYFSPEQRTSMGNAYKTHRAVYDKVCAAFQITNPKEITSAKKANVFYEALINETIAEETGGQ